MFFLFPFHSHDNVSPLYRTGNFPIISKNRKEVVVFDEGNYTSSFPSFRPVATLKNYVAHFG
jgi:hypothetical protein